MSEPQTRPWPRALALLAAGAALSAGLVWAVVAHINAVASGTEIVLEAQGYDPRSLLSGHFTQVTYNINTSVPAPGLVVPKGRTRLELWVVIGPAEGDWRAVSASLERPADLPAGSHAVRATGAAYAYDDATITVDSLRYGIERIYAQQAEAEALADLVVRPLEEGEAPRLHVVASLGGDGKLRIKALIVEGVRKDLTWW